MISTESALSALEVYERWAPTYPPEPHNPLMRAEQRYVLAQLPEVGGRQALDLACGSGRYAQLLASAGAARVVAADFSPAMLSRVSIRDRVLANLTHLPFAAASFDVIVSGLAIGHAGDLGVCLQEIARVLRPGGTVCYSDFHCEAARRGLTRSFRDATDRSFTLPPAGFELDEHRAEAQRAGLVIESIQELRVGEEIREPFKGSEEFYRRWQGVPLVFVLRARK
jgi:ubiquinone/menaquinone biosynthesis C-methylase UbiE